MDAFALPSDWENLPAHLLDSISERLVTSSDYLRFSLVCMSWFGVAKHNQSKHKSHLEPPMLLFFNDKEDAWSLYNVIENKVLDLQLRLPKKRFCGSSKGWLAFVEKDFAVTLIKPFFNSKDGAGRENIVIRLPQLKPPDMEDIKRDKYWVEDCEYYVIKATITSDPILNPNECVVVVIYMEQCQIAFIRPGRDTEWTYISTESQSTIVDVIQRGDEKFYALGRHGNLLTFNITSDSNSNVTSLECDILPNTFIRKYLVHLNGKDWLMVDRSCDWEDDEELISRFADEFKVYQFNFDKCLWIEKKTLGDDVALFIGENLSMCVSASKFPGCKKNCIYYNHDFDFIQMDEDKLNDFGVYDMEKKSISKPYSTDLITLLEMINLRPIWFTPTFHL